VDRIGKPEESRSSQQSKELQSNIFGEWESPHSRKKPRPKAKENIKDAENSEKGESEELLSQGVFWCKKNSVNKT